MADNKAILAGLQAYMANKNAGIGGPVTGIPAGGTNVATAKTPLDETANLRDSIGALVGSGYTGLNANTPPEIRAHVTHILNAMPAKDAQNLLTHISIQNQTPGVAALNPTQRLQRFYDIRSSQPGTDALIQKVKAFGTGPIAAFSETPEVLNQQLATAPVVVKK
jgi:hypothetical protein